MPENTGYVPIKEVAKHFSVSVSTVRTWIRENVIPDSTYIKLGTTYRFNLDAVTKAFKDLQADAEKGSEVESDSSIEEEPDAGSSESNEDTYEDAKTPINLNPEEDEQENEHA
jgi:excisionase family DNA binding protein